MSGETLTFGLQDGGREVSVHPGQPVRIRLPENPTTGFRWQGDFPAGLRVERDGNEPGDAPGAAGMRVIELMPETPGRVELHLRQVQAWEPPSEADTAFDLILDIR